jgi:integrase
MNNQQLKTIQPIDQKPTIDLTRWTKNKFFNFLVYLDDEKQHGAQLRNDLWIIAHLDKNADVDNPKEIERFILRHNGKGSYKRRLAYIYWCYCQFKKIQWVIPKIERQTNEIKPPTTAKVDMIISACGRITSLKLRVMKETGARPIELFRLKVSSIDMEQRYIYFEACKHGNPRKIKVTEQLIQLLKDYINRNQIAFNSILFRGTPVFLGRDFRDSRNLLAKKTNDPTIKQIRLYDIRHYFATMDYHKFQDIKRTQYLMGHKHSNTTDIYTHILDNGEESEYTVKIASNIKEATALIEQGFQYVTEMENVRIFKKRK